MHWRSFLVGLGLSAFALVKCRASFVNGIEISDGPGIIDEAPVRVYFSLLCEGCLKDSSTALGADEALEFSLAIHRLQGIPSSVTSSPLFSVELNHATRFITPQSSPSSLQLRDLNGRSIEESDRIRAPRPTVDLRVLHGQAIPSQTDRTSKYHVNLWFQIMAIDGKALDEPQGFVVAIDPFFEIAHQSSVLGQQIISRNGWTLLDNDPSNPNSPEFDLAFALESLRTSELELTEQRKLIAAYLEDHEDASLKQSLAACDGLMCQVRALLSKLCDKSYHWTESPPSYATVESTHSQYLADSKDVTPAVSTFSTSSSLHQAGDRVQAVGLPLVKVKANNPVVIFFEVLAGMLGLATLFKIIRNRCMSLHRKRERAADLEEKANARAFRRAARRARWQKRWVNIKASINCFKAEEKPQDYNEKRALILQEAYLANLQDLDLAERGQVMEAEIRELRHANEIVSSLVNTVDSGRSRSAIPVHDPPPSMVPLPYSHRTRRRSSVTTLPRYTACESLPEYTSQAETDSVVSIMSGMCTPTTSAASRSRAASQAAVNSAGLTQDTAGSSIIEVSARASEDTTRTRLSNGSSFPS